MEAHKPPRLYLNRPRRSAKNACYFFDGSWLWNPFVSFLPSAPVFVLFAPRRRYRCAVILLVPPRKTRFGNPSIRRHPAAPSSRPIAFYRELDSYTDRYLDHDLGARVTVSLLLALEPSAIRLLRTRVLPPQTGAP